MTWYPIAFLPPQYENTSGDPYSGAVLKAYAAGTNTNIPLATTYQGATTAASLLLNAAGYPVYGGNVIIPHVQENYKLALYPNQTAADANSGAVWTVDDIQIAEDTNSSFVQYFSGDGVTTLFNLSQSLGTDENVLLVFADRTATSMKREIRRPNEYTLNGSSLTLSDVVPAGTNNIIVFAPALLLGAANSAAAAAATSETNAANSAAAAAASAVTAASSASSAASSFDSFDDRYLGAKAANPALDNDGGALLDGALYWNTVGKQLRVYDLGTLTWVAAVVNPTGGPFVAKSGDTMTGALVVPDLAIRSSDSGALTAPVLYIDRASSSPAAMDLIGRLEFDGRNTLGNVVNYGHVAVRIDDATATTEDGTIAFQTIRGGSGNAVMSLADGAVVGAPTGGDKGFGSINAQSAIYVNNVVVPSAQALQADMEAENPGANYVNAQMVQYSPGVAKAFARGDWAGANHTLVAGYNIASIVNNSTGRTTVAWTTPFSSANYAVIVAASVNTGGTFYCVGYIISQNANSVQIGFSGLDNNLYDPSTFTIAAFGDR